MKVHFFQHYKKEEDIVTSNVIMLFARLKELSPAIFYDFVNRCVLETNDESIDFELCIGMQRKGNSKNSIPDAIISRDGFEIVIETKLHGDFWEGQLSNHLEAFSKIGCDYKTLLTIDREDMVPETKSKIGVIIKEFNENNATSIKHKHLTFENIMTEIELRISEIRDYKVSDLLSEFQDYLAYMGLLSNLKNYLYIKPAISTIDENKKYGLYYVSARAAGAFKMGFLGLYKDKTVKYIGKVTSIITARYDSGRCNPIFSPENKNLTEKDKENVKLAMSEAYQKREWTFDVNHHFYIVEEFIETNFVKKSYGGMRIAKWFDLKSELDVEFNSNISAKELAESLKGKEWE